MHWLKTRSRADRCTRAARPVGSHLAATKLPAILLLTKIARSCAAMSVRDYTAWIDRQHARPLLSLPKIPQSSRMSTQPVVSNTFHRSGAHLDRSRQALIVARHQARTAQGGRYGRHVDEVLTEVDLAIGAHLGQIENKGRSRRIR
jgi:hypothetical protein